jgi:hypothetical protein
MSRGKALDLAIAIIEAEEIARQVQPKIVEKVIVEEPKPKEKRAKLQGVVLPLVINVTDQFTDVVQGCPPWFCTFIDNLGPNPIYASVGPKTKGRQIPVSWHWKVEFTRPLIQHLYLVCDSGLTSTANVDGIY